MKIYCDKIPKSCYECNLIVPVVNRNGEFTPYCVFTKKDIQNEDKRNTSCPLNQYERKEYLKKINGKQG